MAYNLNCSMTIQGHRQLRML